MKLRIATERLILTLDQPFQISHGTSFVRENVLVRLSDGVHCGLGEAAVVPYYGYTVDQVLEYLHDPKLEQLLDQHYLTLEALLVLLPDCGPRAARAALDMAIFDLWGQRLGKPLYQIWGYDPAQCPDSSFTVAMAEDEVTYRENLRAARGFKMIKLKLGSGDIQGDLERVRIAREELDCRFALDANGGWSVADAAWIISQTLAPDLVFIEEPVPNSDTATWLKLRQALPPNVPPLIADETVQGIDDLTRLAGIADGVNIKLSKCGGLGPARQMMAQARRLHLLVLIGCMIESSVAVTAAAHLAPGADFADLDGHLLLRDDPFCGVSLSREHGGQITLPGGSGVGVYRTKGLD